MLQIKVFKLSEVYELFLSTNIRINESDNSKIAVNSKNKSYKLNTKKDLFTINKQKSLFPTTNKPSWFLIQFDVSLIVHLKTNKQNIISNNLGLLEKRVQPPYPN